MNTSRCFDSPVTFISKCPDSCGLLMRLCEIDNQRHLDHQSSRLDDWTPSRRSDTFEMLQGFWLHDPLVTLHFTALSHLLLLMSLQCSIARTSPSLEVDTTAVPLLLYLQCLHSDWTVCFFGSPSTSTADVYTYSSVGSKLSRIYPAEWNTHCLRDTHHTPEKRQ